MRENLGKNLPTVLAVHQIAEKSENKITRYDKKQNSDDEIQRMRKRERERMQMYQQIVLLKTLAIFEK